MESSNVVKSSTFSTSVLSSMPPLFGQNYRKTLLNRNRVRMAMHQYCNLKQQEKQIFQQEQLKNINRNNVVEKDEYKKNCHKQQHNRVVEIGKNDVDELLTAGTCVTSTATITRKLGLKLIVLVYLIFTFFIKFIVP